jgi:hypothetical protein
MRRFPSRFALITAIAAIWFVSAAHFAHGSIRVTISDGGVDPTQTFTSPSNKIASFSTVIGGVELFVQTTTSNYPGTPTVGNLLQTVNINDTTPSGVGTLPTFTITADLVDSNGNLLLFTAPSIGTLQVSSDVASAEPVFQSLTGTVQNITTVNGTTVSSLALPINSTVEGEQLGLATNGPFGYTLSSSVIIAGANIGTALSVSASSAVVPPPAGAEGAIPEPGSITILGLGAMGLGLAALRRKRRAT